MSCISIFLVVLVASTAVELDDTLSYLTDDIGIVCGPPMNVRWGIASKTCTRVRWVWLDSLIIIVNFGHSWDLREPCVPCCQVISLVKLCCHMKRTGSKSSCSKMQKTDYLVWQTGGSSFVRTDDSQGNRRALRRCSSFGQAVPRQWRGKWSMTALEVEAITERSNQRKEKETRKLGQKCKK
jgi:hypothetical protein